MNACKKSSKPNSVNSKMDFFPAGTRNPAPKDQKRRLTEEQVRILDLNFDPNKKLEPDHKLHLANRIGIPPKLVAIWFQNKRARVKAQRLEQDCAALQLMLDQVSAEKKLLENDVERLKQELEMTKTLIGDSCKFSQTRNSGFSCASSSFSDDGMSSNFHGDLRLRLDNGDVLQIDEELYAFLTVVNGRRGSSES